MKIKIGKPPRSKSPPEPPAPKEAKPDASLMVLVHEKSRKHRAPRPHKRVHASDLDPGREWCPREPAVLEAFGLKRDDEFLSTAQQITFSLGYAAADTLERFIPEGRLWGNWQCRACGHEQRHRYRPGECHQCGGDVKAIRYREVLMQDPETKLVGSPDMLVDLRGDHVKTLIEVKSEGKEGFAKRTGPSPDHVWRTRLYLYLASVTPWLAPHGIDTESARIVYVCKEGHEPSDALKAARVRDAHRSPLKEYVVTRSDAHLTAAFEKLNAWLAFREAMESGAPVSWPDGVCPSGNCPRAKRCAAANRCFNVSGSPVGPPDKAPL